MILAPTAPVLAARRDCLAYCNAALSLAEQENPRPARRILALAEESQREARQLGDEDRWLEAMNEWISTAREAVRTATDPECFTDTPEDTR